MPPKQSSSEKLIEALRSLRATGPAGFEGLIRDLMAAFTGQRFRLARSGFQAGRDMSTGSGGAIVIAVECKRFGAATDPDDDQLLGKLFQAKRDLQPDIWVLAISREVGDRTSHPLRELAELAGVEFVILDCTEAGTGPLPALCAAYPEITSSALARYADSRNVRTWLSRLCGHPQHEAIIENLGRELRTPHVGFASTAEALRERFLKALTESEASKVRFGQRILPRAPGSHDVKRVDSIALLDSWWRFWENRQDILVVEGEEGTGKSWALASWLASRTLENQAVPILVWLSAQFFEFRDLIACVVEHLAKEFTSRSAAVHDKRFRAWAALPSTYPRVVIVVDGMNERADRARWQKWLSEARQTLSSLPGVALVLTSRSLFWLEIKPSLERLDLLVARGVAESPSAKSKICNVNVGDFSDAELEEAMSAEGLKNDSLPLDLAGLVRRPRYFSIAARHWEHLADSGDFTRERLFFEEWRDRASARRQQELGNGEFEEILIAMAKRAREVANLTVSRSQLVELLHQRTDWEDRLGDLVTSGVFVPVPGAPGKFRISKDRLYVGLGLSLLEEAALRSPQGIDAAVETVASALEPAGDADDVGAIVRHAVCAALVSADAPPEARVAVLLALARQRNGAGAWQQAAPWIYYPDNPKVLACAAEREWMRDLHHAEARERFAFCYSHIADRWQKDANLIRRVGIWLGYVPVEGVKDFEGFHARLTDARAAIDALDLPVIVREADARSMLGVAPLAFLIASHGPHREYVNALVAWALSPWESDEAKWWVRTADATTRRAIAAAASGLAGLGTEVARYAATLLFRVEGSRESLDEAEALSPIELPHDLYAWSTVEAAYAGRSNNADPTWLASKLSRLALDPAVSFEQFRWDIEGVLESIDVSQFGGRMRTIASQTLESAEETLCRLVPKALSVFFLEVVRSQLDRVPSDPAGVYLLEEAFLLLEPSDLARVYTLQKDLDHPTRVSNPRTADDEPHLAGVWLASLADGEEQLAYLLSRTRADDDRRWLELLGPLSKLAVDQMIEQLPTATPLGRLRRLLPSWGDSVELRESQREIVRAAANGPGIGIVSAFPPQHARDPELLVQFTEDGFYDDELLSRILKNFDWARSGAQKISTRLGDRLGPASRTWVIAESGLEQSDLREWAKQVDEDLRRLRGPRILGQDGHYSCEVVACALDVAPSILNTWIDSILAHDACGMEITRAWHGLLASLVLALLNRDDMRGLEIVRVITKPGALVTPVDGTTQIPTHSFWPFEAVETKTTQETVAVVLDQALSNEDLQQLVWAAHYHKRSAVLQQAAEAVAKDSAFQAARALMISGLGPYDAPAADELGRVERCESSWVRWAAKQARLDLQLDGHAQHWFRTFLRSPDRPEAWAAFRLFLKCVDRRWWLWKDRELQDARQEPDYRMRVRHLTLNSGEIDERAKKRMDDRKKQLFAWPIPSFDLIPWKRGWRL